MVSEGADAPSGFPLLSNSKKRALKRGFAPLTNSSPSPLKERGIQGARLIDTLFHKRSVNHILDWFEGLTVDRRWPQLT
jgi:hypothetical protein